MGWSPIYQVDTGSKSASESLKEQRQLENQLEMIAILNGIREELQLLSARFEEAYETDINASDL